MSYTFDRIIDRRTVENRNKWTWFPEEVHPMWVADMDFLTPAPVLKAVERTLEHGILGYELAGGPLLETVAARMEKLYGWKVAPEMVVPIPGVNAGLSAVSRVFAAPGEGVLVQPPIFPPFIRGPRGFGQIPQSGKLRAVASGATLRYEIDFAAFESAIGSRDAQTRVFLFCNPHNPSGRAFSRDEVERMARICRKHQVLICSDEIHSEILLGDVEHTPIAALSPAIGNRTITLVGPSKMFNLPGLACAFAIVANKSLRKRLADELGRTAGEVNSLGLAGAKAAFSGECDEWMFAMRAYLKANRDFAVQFIRSELPGIRTTVPEATFLLWLDCNPAIKAGRIQGSPYKFFLEKGKLALTDGEEFGPGSKGFVRLNFACPRATLEEGLARMKRALVG